MTTSNARAVQEPLVIFNVRIAPDGTARNGLAVRQLAALVAITAPRKGAAR